MMTRLNEHAHPPSGEPSVAELFSRLAAETAALVRRDLALLARDMGAKVKAMMGFSWLMGGGALVAVLGAELVVFSGILRLGYEIPLWIAAGLVGVSLVASGLVAMTVGRRAIAKIDLFPTKAQETLKESIAALGAFVGMAIPFGHRKADLPARDDVGERAERLAEKVSSRIEEATVRVADDLDKGWNADSAGTSER